ncbi:MAG: DUF2723 domain-containing protein [bacterium]
MQSKRTHYIFAGIAFFVGFFTYFLTMQPSISFWDCGEFAAAAFGLQVGHPPGAPLWALMGKFAMMLPTSADMVARYNLFSVIASALSILLLYLTSARLIKLWRGEPKSTADMITTYGGALIAALSYCFTDSFWFNALECEVYAFGSLFISIIPWIMLVWYDHADEEHSEKYLLLVAYIMGLSLGVHQLALLAVFPCFMLIYYRRRKDTSVGSWLTMVLSSCVAFIIAFKLVLSELVELLGGGATGTGYAIIGSAIAVWIYNATTKATASKEKGYFGVSKRTYTQIAIAFLTRYILGWMIGNFNPSPSPTVSKLVGYLLILGAIAGILYSQREKKALLNLCLWSVFLMFMGYSTYYLYIVRAGQEPPMNQWHADNFATITKFINRDQYGYRPPWPRQVGDQERPHDQDPTFTDYSGNMDFFWRYQTNEMYNRYLMWNFVGRVSQADGAGIDWSKTWGIPLFLGLFGMYWHFKRDPKRALTILGAFILFGWATAWYQNQQDPQPRERDYFYVGAFYLYAMWIGIGATGIMEMLRAKKSSNPNEDNSEASNAVPIGAGNVALLGAAFAAAVVFVPLNQAVGLAGMLGGKSFDQTSKWREYSRSHNNIPLEYAYNVLQSCEKDAILFTAGDNDTFPLWCAQDVYGIRRDIRIVNLSLGNMGWYIRQLLKDSWGVGKKVNLPGFPDSMLHDLDDKQLHEAHQFRDKPKMETVKISAATMVAFTGNPNAHDTTMTWKYRGQIPLDAGETYFIVADELVRTIVEGNINSRPIYFAPFVQDQYFVGLRPYVQSEGMAQRVTPVIQTGGGPLGALNEALSAESALNLVDKEHLSLTPKRGYFLSTFSDPDARWSNADRTNAPPFFSMVRSYYALAEKFALEGKFAEANKTLAVLDKAIPPERVLYEDRIAPLIAALHKRLGNAEMAKKYSKYALADLERGYGEIANAAQLGGREANQGAMYAQALINAGDLEKAQTVLQHLAQVTTDKQEQGLIMFRSEQVEAMITDKRGDKKKALELYDRFFANYGVAIANSGADFAAEFNELHARVDALRKEVNPQATSDTSMKGAPSKK